MMRARRFRWCYGPFVIALLASSECSVEAQILAGSETAVASFKSLIARPNVALQPTTTTRPAIDGLHAEHVVFTSEPGQRVPLLLLKADEPTEPRRPVVIVLHGTGGTKEQNLVLIKRLAHRGFVAVGIDGRYHGERCAAGEGTVDYYAAIAQAYRGGKSHPWLFDTVYDVGRTIDYLTTRADVDPDRIGLMGFSKGGMSTLR